MTRYRIEVGRKDGVRPGSIVGAIANEAGIDGNVMGAIRIHDAHSTIDLPAGMPSETLQILQFTRVVGKPMQMTETSEAADGDMAGRGGRPKRGKKPFGGKAFAHGKKTNFAKRKKNKTKH